MKPSIATYLGEDVETSVGALKIKVNEPQQHGSKEVVVWVSPQLKGQPIPQFNKKVLMMVKLLVTSLL